MHDLYQQFLFGGSALRIPALLASAASAFALISILHFWRAFSLFFIASLLAFLRRTTNLAHLPTISFCFWNECEGENKVTRETRWRWRSIMAGGRDERWTKDWVGMASMIAA